MLERPGLLLTSWEHAGDMRSGFRWHDPEVNRPRTRIRLILAPETREALGYARWRAPVSLPNWLGWLASQCIEVFETDDASLLLRLRRPFGPGRAWELRDADDRRVGYVGGKQLRDGFGQPVADVEASPGQQGLHFLAGDSSLLAAAQDTDHDLRITFASVLEGQPFTRMLIMAAVLLIR